MISQCDVQEKTTQSKRKSSEELVHALPYPRLSLSLSPSSAVSAVLFFRFAQHNDTGWGTRGRPKPNLSPLPRGGLAATQGEEVGSNERSWPGAERPGSALLDSLANTRPPNYREQSRAAGHLSLHPKPPSSLPLHSFL